jgi:hypothetical protein
MGISQQIGASSLIKPGVIDNTAARPASPYEGQVIYQKDTDEILAYNGTSWTRPWNMPWGIQSFTKAISSDLTITGEEVQITGGSFTAVANRYYKVTYFEPDIYQGTTYVFMRIRLSSISGTILNTGAAAIAATTDGDRIATVTWVGTLSAGTSNFVGTLSSASGTAKAARAADTFAFILVEDIGPA